MPSILNEALEWFDRAEQAREVAEQLTDPSSIRIRGRSDARNPDFARVLREGDGGRRAGLVGSVAPRA